MARVQASGRVMNTPSTLPFRGNNPVLNGMFEIAPAVITAATNVTNRFIDGTAAGSNANTGLGWGIISLASSAEAGFDSTNPFVGTYGLRLSTLNATGTVVVGTYKTSPTYDTTFQLYPSTTYNIQARIKTNNVVTNSAFMDFREYDGTFGILATTSSAKFSGTNAYTLISFNVTTNASTKFGTILLRNNIAGNVSDVWFDSITVRPINGVQGRVQRLNGVQA